MSEMERLAERLLHESSQYHPVAQYYVWRILTGTTTYRLPALDSITDAQWAEFIRVNASKLAVDETSVHSEEYVTSVIKEWRNTWTEYGFTTAPSDITGVRLVYPNDEPKRNIALDRAAVQLAHDLKEFRNGHPDPLGTCVFHYHRAVIAAYCTK